MDTALHTTPRRTDGDGWVRRVGALNVMKVKGSFHEMGRQHGALLREQIPRGPLPYYRTYIERLLGPSLGPATKLVWPAVQTLVGRRVAKAMLPFILETLQGMAEGSGQRYEDLLAGGTMPDALLWVASRVMQVKGPGPAMHHRLALNLGCTSAVAWGDATSDGRLLHARNFDYHGVRSWPETATVIFHEPDAGQRYVSVAAAGVPLGGVTAMNEAGLSLTVHQHMFTDKAALGGTPIGLVGDIVMREARSLDDAERILAKYVPIGCWTYLITDAHTKQVLCWEENPDRRASRRTTADDATFGYANIYLDRELGSTEVNLYGSYWRHNQGRHRRVNELLAPGGLDPAAMAGILGDTGDSGCRLRSSICMLMTVGSVVFRPEDGVLWVGNGEAPTSGRPFLPFSLAAEDYAPEHGTLAPAPAEPAAADAFEQYRLAYLAYGDDGDLTAAHVHLDAACTMQPDQPLYRYVTGLVALSEGDAAAADESLTAAIALAHPDPERRAAFHLWRGRARDLLGRREQALGDYRATLGHHADPPVTAAARKALRRPFKGRTFQIDFAHADVVSP